jgi:hypothetical protein
MTQTYLLLTGERARLQQLRDGQAHRLLPSAKPARRGGTGVQRYLSPASALWREDADRITTYVTRYLEEVRRCAWHRGGMIKARAMAGGTQQNRKTSLEKGNPRTVRRNTVPGLGEELADRTQQRIVRHAAWGCGRFCDARSTCRVFLEGAGGGCRCRIYGHLPAVRYSKDKLSNNGK